MKWRHLLLHVQNCTDQICSDLSNAKRKKTPSRDGSVSLYVNNSATSKELHKLI